MIKTLLLISHDFGRKRPRIELRRNFSDNLVEKHLTESQWQALDAIGLQYKILLLLAIFSDFELC